MRHLSGKDLAWLKNGVPLFENPGQMTRSIKKYALKEGPKHPLWKYAWGLVEETVFELWSARGSSAPPSPAGSLEMSVKRQT